MFIRKTLGICSLCVALLFTEGCRREDEDLTAGIRGSTKVCEPNDGSSSSTADSTGTQPPPVALTDDEMLFSAAQSGNLSRIRALLGEGRVSLDARDGQGRTALMFAAEFGHLEVVEFIMGQNPELALLADASGLTAADYALNSDLIPEDRLVAMLQLLRGEEVNPEDLEPELISLLQESFSPENLERIAALLEKGVSPDAQDQSDPEAEVPAIFLSMGVRSGPRSGQLSLSGQPEFDYAAALVSAGADLTVTVSLRGAKTPYELLTSRGVGDRFDARKDEWLELLQPSANP